MDDTKAQEALQHFETIWEHVECGIVIVDAETRRIQAVNPVAARMFGGEAKELVGNLCHRFICPADSCTCPIMDQGLVVDRSERRFIRADGTAIPIIKSVAKIQYNNRLALLESFTDISHLKEAEAKLLKFQVAEQANQAKSDFLSRMSHEMRTPMNAVIGMAKIAEKTNDPAKLKYCLSMIGVSSAHLLGLINDVLDMAKIEAGKLELDSAPLNIETIMARICNLIIEKVEEKKQILKVTLGKNMPLHYSGDELRIAQVVTNLMSNAVKFTPNNGTISLAVDMVKQEGSVSTLRFDVADTGIGMTPEQVEHLFGAFEQADKSITRRFGGTGLGLAISKNIVEKMNGSITVHSTPGEGSVFSALVELEALPEESLSAGDAAFFAGKKALLASDNVDEVQIFQDAIETTGIHLDVVSCAAEAIRHIALAVDAGQPYHAVFSDFALPDMDAVAMAALLQSKGLPTGNFVVMASFSRWNTVGQAAHTAGVGAFLVTPLFPSAVLQTLRDVLGHKAELLTPEEQSVPDFSAIRVLLAEDVEINQEIFISLLEETGLQVDVAADGLEAVTMFRANPGRYHAIFMDVQMPQMNGLEATEAIRKLDVPGADAIPIIAMTANVFTSEVEKCLACGMNHHLAKPIDEDKVREAIQRYCTQGPA